jgi:hypothetical protein
MLRHAYSFACASASHDPDSIARAGQHTSANTTLPHSARHHRANPSRGFPALEVFGRRPRSMSRRCHGAHPKTFTESDIQPGFPLLVVAQFEVLSEGREKEFPVARGRTIDDGSTSPRRSYPQSPCACPNLLGARIFGIARRPRSPDLLPTEGATTCIQTAWLGRFEYGILRVAFPVDDGAELFCKSILRTRRSRSASAGRMR